ncbi:PaaI family thioesterase [Luteococcus sp. Sow4_B9]|uniref:PaaI family thioesterase n=1 Tax=Luteococcus sp. Sow4_B9 TaxID=3438792 RepID=UPI003F9776D5
MTSALDDKLGVELLEVSAERTVARMPVAGNTQVIGLLHGGANAALVETAGSVAALAHARELGGIAVGVDINVTHHRAVRSGSVTAVATSLHRGRSLANYLVEITDEDGNRVATGRLTCMVRPRP